MLEIFSRLFVALSLSLGMGLLLAWGWDQSDQVALNGPGSRSSTLLSDSNQSPLANAHEAAERLSGK